MIFTLKLLVVVDCLTLHISVHLVVIVEKHGHWLAEDAKEKPEDHVAHLTNI